VADEQVASIDPSSPHARDPEGELVEKRTEELPRGVVRSAVPPRRIFVRPADQHLG
jgi:hypothetical protein